MDQTIDIKTTAMTLDAYIAARVIRSERDYTNWIGLLRDFTPTQRSTELLRAGIAMELAQMGEVCRATESCWYGDQWVTVYQHR